MQSHLAKAPSTSPSNETGPGGPQSLNQIAFLPVCPYVLRLVSPSWARGAHDSRGPRVDPVPSAGLQREDRGAQESGSAGRQKTAAVRRRPKSGRLDREELLRGGLCRLHRHRRDVLSRPEAGPARLLRGRFWVLWNSTLLGRPRGSRGPEAHEPVVPGRLRVDPPLRGGRRHGLRAEDRVRDRGGDG